MVMRAALSGLAFFAVVGCVSVGEPIPNLPKGHSVVVIPFNSYSNQIEAAQRVEMHLVNLGFNVRRYNADVREIETRSGVGVAGAEFQSRTAGAVEARGADTQQVTIERYKTYEKITADIAFEVLAAGYASSDATIKIVRVNDGAVMGVAECELNWDRCLKAFLVDKKLLVESGRASGALVERPGA